MTTSNNRGGLARTLAALSLSALALAACDGGQGRGQDAAANSGLCIDFKQAKSGPAPPATDGAGAVDECVRRWAYSLAPSRDEAQVVADAVAAACGGALGRWNQQTLTQADASGEATSLITGEPTTPLAEHASFTRTRALLYVVQARAGRCAPPPAANGAPQGVG